MAVLASIEGCIGVGKSTVKAALQRLVADDASLAARVHFVDEPVDAWEKAELKVEGSGMLELFYDDPARWALTFQLLAHATRLTALKEARKAHPGAILVSERSLAADEHTFAKMLADSGDMTPAEHRVYCICARAADARAYAPDFVFHLTAPAATTMERIAKRQRAGEAGVTRAYNERLARYTATWLDTLDPASVVQLEVGARGDAAVLATAEAMRAELRKWVAGCEQPDAHDDPVRWAADTRREWGRLAVLAAPTSRGRHFVYEGSKREHPVGVDGDAGREAPVADTVDVVEATTTGC